MKKWGIAFLLFLCATRLFALPLTEAQKLCADKSEGDWTYIHLAKESVSVREFLENVGVTGDHVVCRGRGDTGNIALSYFRGGVFVLFLDSGFANEHPEDVRAITAHEVAHLIADKNKGCNKAGAEKRGGDLTYCESGVDWVASLWVGKSAVKHMLTSVQAYLIKPQFAHEVTIGWMLQIDARIQAVDKFPD